MKVSGIKNIVVGKFAEVALVKITHDDPKLSAFRIGKCNECKHLTKSRNCGICGCVMDIKVQATTHFDDEHQKVIFTHCPLGKWADGHITNMYREMLGKKRLNYV